MAAKNTLEFFLRMNLGEFLSATRSAETGFSRSMTAMSGAAAITARQVDGAVKSIGNVQAFTKLRSEVVATAREFSQAKAKVQELAKQIKASAEPSKALTAEYKKAQTAASKLSAKLKEQTAAAGQLKENITRAGVSVKDLAAGEKRLNQTIIQTTATLRRQVKETQAWSSLGVRSTREVEREIKRLEVAYQRMARSGKASANDLSRAQVRLRQRITELRRETSVFHQQLGSLQGQWLAFSGVLAATGLTLGGLIGKFVSFDDTMRKVGVVSGATAEQIDQMRATAKEMGASTRYSATEAAQGLEFLAMSGMSATDAIQALPPTLQLAAAGSMELGAAADILTNIMAGYGKRTSDLVRINDALVATFTGSNTTLQDLGVAFSYAGPVAKSAGMAFNETATMLGVLASGAYKGERGGTALRGALTLLLNPTADVTAVLGELGVSVHDSSGRLLPFTEILHRLRNAGISTSQIMRMFGKVAGPAMAYLIEEGGTAIDTLREKVDHSGGTAQRVADEMEAGLGGALRALRSTAEGLALEFGESLAPVIMVVANGLTILLRIIQSLSPATKTYLSVLFGAGVIFAIWNLGLKQLVTGLRAVFAAQVATTAATTALGVALRMAGWVGLALLIWEVVSALFKGASALTEWLFGTEKSTDATDGLTEALRRQGSASDQISSALMQNAQDVENQFRTSLYGQKELAGDFEASRLAGSEASAESLRSHHAGVASSFQEAMRLGETAAANASTSIGQSLSKVSEQTVKVILDADGVQEGIVDLEKALAKLTDKKIAVQVAVDAALDNIAQVDLALEDLEDKTITITTRYVEEHAGGGWAGILALAGGGKLPGFGGGDRIPALLEAGEFVIRKERARLFSGLLNLMNYGPISRIQQVMADIPRLQTGGIIPNIRVPRLAMASGGPVPSSPVERFDVRWNGRPVASSPDPGSQLRGLLDELKEGSRGLLP